MNEPSTTRDLFGGAITAHVPQHAIDASEIRQVPDTQEVFIFPDSSISIVVEILQKVAQADLLDAAKLSTYRRTAKVRSHTYAPILTSFDSSIVHSTLALPKNFDNTHTPPAILLSGTQVVRKFNTTTPDTVQIFLALYRVDAKDVDLVVSMNVPAEEGPSAQGPPAANAKMRFDELVQSLRIVDLGLFA